IGPIDGAAVDCVEVSNDPGRPGTQRFDSSRPQLRAEARPGFEQQGRNGWLIKTCKHFHGRSLNELRLTETQKLWSKRFDVREICQTQRADGGHATGNRALLVGSSLQGVAEQFVKGRPNPASVGPGEPIAA